MTLAQRGDARVDFVARHGRRRGRERTRARRPREFPQGPCDAREQQRTLERNAQEAAFALRSLQARRGELQRALETAGGIARALPQLDEVFWLLAGDVFVPDFVFSLEAVQRFAASSALAHVWLVPNPEHHPHGDFGLSPEGLALNLPPEHAGPHYTYSTIGLFRAAPFTAPYCTLPPGNPQGTEAPLAPVLRAAMADGRITGELHTGRWTDVGTPERLAALNAQVCG